MSGNFYDDPSLLGYWFDEENGISQHLGFFHLMDNLRSSDYTTTEGNPIETWLQPVEGSETDYAGIAYAELDGLYIARSGSKIVRPFYVSRWVNKALSVRTQAVLRITRMYAPKWLKLWETMFYDYDPIENYSMVEEVLKDKTRLTHGKKTKIAGTETTQTDLTSQIKAYDASAVWKDSDKQSGSNTLTYGAGQNERYNQDSGTDLSEHEYKFTRKGNIGVTTSQQMIEQERKLLMYNYFDEIVFPDIDKVLTLQVY